MKNTKKGFTLTELLVTIAILAILATISIVGYVSFITRANESNAKSEAYQIEQIIESALILDERVYIEKAEDYFIIFVRDGKGYKVSFSTSKPNGVKISDIPQNLVDGLEYVEFGGLTYTSKAGIVVVIKEATNTPQDPAHEHTEVIDAAVDATCTSTGLTEGKHCSECGEVLIAQTVLPIVAHSYDNDDDASCNVCGYERDVSCVHIEETINGYDSTCTKAGLTDGKKCSKCGEILVSQTVIPVKDHIESDWIIDKEATFTEEGFKHTECIVCSKRVSENVIPVIVPTSSEGLALELNADKTAYIVTGVGDCKDAFLVIPQEHNGLPVVEIASRAFEDCTEITQVYVPISVKKIGEAAFHGCSSIESMILPFVGSLANATSGGNATCFAYIFGRTSFDGGYAVSAQYIYGNAWFYIPKTLKNVTITGGNGLFDYAFYGCDYIESITLPDSISTIGKEAFMSCDNLKNVSIGNFVESIGEYAFYGCKSLTSITIPVSVTSIGEKAFSNCSSLVDVHYDGTIEDWCNIDFGGKDSSPVRYGSNIYVNGSIITELVVPDTVTIIDDWAFSNWTSLKSIIIPQSVKKIGEGAFSGCSSIESMTLPFVGYSSTSTSGSDMTCFGYIFGEIPYEGGYKALAKYVYNTTYYYIPQTLKNVTITGGNGLFNYAFYACDYIESITLPDSISTIGKEAFMSCDNLKNVSIGNSVESIGEYAFASCKSLTSITIPVSVTSIGEKAFSNCSSLGAAYYKGTLEDWCNIDFNGHASSPAYNGADIYIDGSIITELVVPDTVTIIDDWAFSNWTSLKSIIIPQSVKKIGEAAFHGCSSIESMTLPFVGYSSTSTSGSDMTCFGYIFGETSYEGGYGALAKYVYNTTYYYIPTTLKNVTITGGNGLFDYAFYACDYIESITLPDSISTIGKEAFMSCDNLKNVSIGNSVESIGEYAFSSCKSLANMYYNGTVEQWNAIAKGLSWSSGVTATVICSDGTVSIK